MSVIKRKPYLESLLESLSEDDKIAVLNEVNSNEEKDYYSLIERDYYLPRSGKLIDSITLRLAKDKILSGIVILTDEVASFIGYDETQNIYLYELDLEIMSASLIEEPCSILELRSELADEGAIPPALSARILEPYFEGNDQIVVEVNETGEKIVIELDQDFINSIQGKLTAGAGVSITENNVISASGSLDLIVVSQLPTASDSTYGGKIYLVEKVGTEQDIYDEFITVRTGTSTFTYSWEKIGTTQVDLSQYQKKLVDSTEIVVDNTNNNLHLAQSVSNVIAKALVHPTQAPSKISVVAINTNNAQTNIQLNGAIENINGALAVPVKDIAGGTMGMFKVVKCTEEEYFDTPKNEYTLYLIVEG